MKAHTPHAHPATATRASRSTPPTVLATAATVMAVWPSAASAVAVRGERGGEGMGGPCGCGGADGGGIGARTRVVTEVLRTEGVEVMGMPRSADAAVGEKSFSPTLATRLEACASPDAATRAVTTTDAGAIVMETAASGTPANTARLVWSCRRRSKP